MKIYDNPPRSEWDELCLRACSDNSAVEKTVRAIIDRVRADGDTALVELAREIDGVETGCIEVGEAEFAAAAAMVSDDVKIAIDNAYANIHAFHKAQCPREIRVQTSPGVTCIQRPVAIRRVGMYIPGGTAPLFSTVLMLAIPALVAGCPERILCTPVGRNGKVAPEVLYAARRCSVTKVFKTGGAQAVAAMAFGTESVPKVDKIFGPGNRFVTTAKQMVSSMSTAIDMPAGPSEVMVLADSSANPAFVAADLLSQAEHGRDSQAILVCGDSAFAQAAVDEINRQSALLPRGGYIASSLENSRAIVLDKVEDRLAFANLYAPEHLIISMQDASEVADSIFAAGSVFIGNWTPESAGDYASGTNHTLPTSGWAHSFSGVNIDSFMRKMTLQEITPEGLAGLSSTIVSMAEAEGLEAHANAVKVRLASVSGACAGKEGTDGFLKRKVRRNIYELSPYSTARDEFKGHLGIFLDANESPYQNGYNRYPDPRQKELKELVAAKKGIKVENLFLGNGSDEAIDLMFRIFCEPGLDNAVAIAPSYGMYKVSAATNDVEIREVQLGQDFSLPAEELLAATDSRTKLMFLCSPNNPSGNAFDKRELVKLAESFDGIIVVDEAYVDFSSKGSLVDEIAAHPSIIVLQTLSKAWAMAGLRIGLAIADKRIIDIMSMVKYPYNISKAAQEKAVELLTSGLDRNVPEIVRQRDIVAGKLLCCPQVLKVWPSDANFILARFRDADAMYDHLTSRGIIVRKRNRIHGCEGCLRITVGLEEENEKLFDALEEYGK